MENTGQVAVAQVQTPGGRVTYSGDAAIDGVPGTAAPIALMFRDTAGSTCGALLPTGNLVDQVAGTKVTLIDNGMPCIIILAEDMGITGHESRETLDTDTGLKTRLEAIRLAAGPLMNLGDVTDKSVPKMMLVAPPAAGGSLAVRSFIPHRCHAGIGVLGAVSVATAALLPGSPAAAVANLPPGSIKTIVIEHPTGVTECVVTVDDAGQVVEAGMLRTARLLMDGKVFA